MNAHKYKWLLFDADGTLFDFEKTEVIALQRTIEQSGHHYQTEHLTIYQQINQQLWADFEQGKVTQDVLKQRRFELFLAAIDLDDTCSSAQFAQRYLENLATGSYLLEGAEEVVKALADQYKLLIITNGVKEVQRSRFQRSTIYSYFDHIIVSGEVGVAKPAPEIFDITFAAMGHPKKEEVLIIGDSLTSDMRGGYNYGIDTCWYNPTQKQYDGDLALTYEIEKLGELQKLLGVI